jgi:hypothetical protein
MTYEASPITHTQKDLTTWAPILNGANANVTVSTVDGKFHADGVPAGYTLVYYPNVGTYDNYTGDVYPVEGTNMNLPMANDLNGSLDTSDYCTNEFNPGATPCAGAKLWLVPDADISATVNANGSRTLTWDGANFLFETSLMTYEASPTSGGNSSGSRARPAVPATPAVPGVSPAIPATPAVPSGQVLGAEKFIFTKFMKLGSTGNEVLELQKLLTAQMYYAGPLDGIFGSLTEEAVKTYQAAHPPLRIHGIVGPKTRGVLNA